MEQSNTGGARAMSNDGPLDPLPLPLPIPERDGETRRAAAQHSNAADMHLLFYGAAFGILVGAICGSIITAFYGETLSYRLRYITRIILRREDEQPNFELFLQ